MGGNGLSRPGGNLGLGSGLWIFGFGSKPKPDQGLGVYLSGWMTSKDIAA